MFLSIIITSYNLPGCKQSVSCPSIYLLISKDIATEFSIFNETKNAMDSQIWQWPVASGLIAALIGAVVSFFTARFTYKRQKLLDFRYEYHMYILEKRRTAYDKIESVLKYLDDSRNHHIGDIWGRTTGKHALQKLEELLHERLTALDADLLWWSRPMFNSIRQMQVSVNDLIHHIKWPESTEEDIQNRSMKVFVKRLEMLKVFHEDMLCLDDVERYRTEKINEYQSLIDSYVNMKVEEMPVPFQENYRELKKFLNQR